MHFCTNFRHAKPSNGVWHLLLSRVRRFPTPALRAGNDGCGDTDLSIRHAKPSNGVWHLPALLFTLLLVGSAAYGDVPSMFTLGEVTSESSDKLSIITIKLDRPPGWSKVEMEDHGNFLQFALPNTLVTDSGSFVVSHIPWIKTIGVFQSTPQTGMVRLFLSEDGAGIKKRLESEIV